MLRRRRRRLADQAASGGSHIDGGATITGNLRCEGDILLAGSAKGECWVGGTLTLSDKARWERTIEAQNAVIAGQIQGNITVVEKLEVRKSATLRGSVRARTVAVAEGATLEAEMTVTSNSPVIRFEEKRKER